MEACAQKQEIQNKKVERRLLGKNVRFLQRVELSAAAKQAGGVGGRRRRRRDEAAARFEDDERSDEDNQVKRKSGR